jgi:ATP-binding cassette, subfamily C (CFTR/MRP), member 1
VVIYAFLSLGSACFFFVRFALFISFALKVSKNIFQGLLKVVLRAPLFFFDITPLGRIISRFTSDIDKVDFMLSINL